MSQCHNVRVPEAEIVWLDWMGGQDRRESEATAESEELLVTLWRELLDPLASLANLEPRGLMDSPVYPGSQGWLD